MRPSELFQKEFFFDRLSKRKKTFLEMIKHLEKFESGHIIETGTLRIEDNFEGDGQSTYLWNWFLHQSPGYLAVSVDLDPKAVEISARVCPAVAVIESDSLKFLTSLHDEVVDQCRLLYLDSFDWAPEIHMDSCFHHMSELACIYARLPEGCMIVVDDKHDQYAGKHMMVQFFFESLGIPPAFDSYQIGWIKP